MIFGNSTPRLKKKKMTHQTTQQDQTLIIQRDIQVLHLKTRKDYFRRCKKL